MISSIYTALDGLRLHQQRIERAADRISRIGQRSPTTPGRPIDLPSEMVEMMTAKYGYQANLQVIRSADELLGNLLDRLA